MLRNYIITALRNLWRNKFFSGINILGLSLGLSACIIILLFVRYEKNFDAFHTKSIYRLNEIISWQGMVVPQKVPLSMYPMAATLKADLPEIKSITHICLEENSSLKYKEQRVFFKRAFLADSNFLKLFDFKLLKGEIREALKKPRSIVLTPESAEKLFGQEDPIGKMVSCSNSADSLPFTITGILPVPKNSHLQFEALYTINSFVKSRGMDQWGINGMVTYLELNSNADAGALEKKFPAYLKKYMLNKGYKLLLQPLSEIHGGSADITYDFNNYQKFNSDYTRVFIIIAAVVLIIGCINFVNLSTARSLSRAKEVGVKKSVGAHRSQLIAQFIVESILFACFAMLLAIGFVILFLPYASQLSDHELSLSFLKNPTTALKLIIFTAFIGLISGVYPALYLSSFNAINVFKDTQPGHAKSFMRNALVIVQFAGAVLLIITTLFIIKQLHFMQTRDMGFNRNQVVMLPGAYKNWYRLKDELLKSTLIKSVSGSTQKLGNSLHEASFRFYGNGPARDLSASHILVDYDFVNLYEIQLVAGRNFTREGEGREFIVNEKLAKELLKEDADAPLESLIGKRMILDEDTSSKIVGVCSDFNFNSLHHQIETLCLYNKKRWGYSDVCVKIDGARTKEALDYIKSTWRAIMPAVPYEYQFLDDHFAALYETDKKVSRVVGALAGLAIVIACLGLFGLASYTTARRIKEVGIRKVLGASTQSLATLLSKDFLKLVLIAIVIASPIAWYLVNAWLQNFAYRISISIWVYIIAAVSALAIALFTVCFQAIKAAISNPVKSLRTE